MGKGAERNGVYHGVKFSARFSDTCLILYTLYYIPTKNGVSSSYESVNQNQADRMKSKLCPEDHD